MAFPTGPDWTRTTASLCCPTVKPTVFVCPQRKRPVTLPLQLLHYLSLCLSAGRLCLSLDKDSFEILGVEGKPSRFNFRTKSRYGPNVDVTH